MYVPVVEVVAQLEVQVEGEEEKAALAVVAALVQLGHVARSLDYASRRKTCTRGVMCVCACFKEHVADHACRQAL